MLSARSFMLAASCVFACALQGALAPSVARAQTIDLSLNVFYSNPASVNSGGSWVLVAKSSGFGIGGIEARLINTSGTPVELAPRGKVNGSDPAGFGLFQPVVFPTYLGLIIGQTQIDGLMGAEEQGAFYGVGKLINGAPDYPGKPVGSNSEPGSPAFTSLTNPIGIPWANTPDPFGDSAWNTAARMASGTFLTNVTPAFETGSSGNVFTSIGTSAMFGTLTSATVTTTVRTNFGIANADYNHNGIVDAADYILWRNTKGMSVPNGTGADGNGSGVVDDADYTLWRSHFGAPLGAGSGGSVSTSVVPEPMSGCLLVLAAIIYLCIYRQPPRRLTLAVAPVFSQYPTRIEALSAVNQKSLPQSDSFLRDL